MLNITNFKKNVNSLMKNSRTNMITIPLKNLKKSRRKSKYFSDGFQGLSKIEFLGQFP